MLGTSRHKRRRGSQADNRRALREALRLHIEHMRERFGAYPFLVERRARNDSSPVKEQHQEDTATARNQPERHRYLRHRRTYVDKFFAGWHVYSVAWRCHFFAPLQYLK